MNVASTLLTCTCLARVGVVLAAVGAVAEAQVALRWTANQDLSQIGSGDAPHSMTVDPVLNRLYVVGSYQTSMAGFGLGEAFVSAYDFDGSHVWTRAMPTGAGHTTSLYRAAVHPDGGVVAVGVDFVPTQSVSDTLVARIDASGNLLWTRLFDGSAGSLDDGDDVVVDPSGVSHVLARTWSDLAIGMVPVLVRYDANGTLLGTTAVGDPNELTFTGRIVRLGGGDLLVSTPPRVTRVTATGATVWSTAGVNGSLDASSVAADGSIYLAGTGAAVPPANIGPFQVTRLDPNGNVAWERAITDAVFVGGSAASLAVLPSGATVAAGFRSTDICAPGGFLMESVVASYDVAGNLLWQKTNDFAGLVLQEFWQVEAVSNGDAVLLGITRDAQDPGTPRIVRVTPDGDVRWLVTPPAIFESGQSLALIGVGTGDELFSVRTSGNGPSAPADITLARFDATLATYCLGDGSATACPCGNAAPVGSLGGCVNSVGTVGRLVADGNPSLATDTVVLSASGLTNSNVLFFQGTTAIAGGSGASFGDGLRCVGGAITRLAVQSASAGLASYPSAGDESVSLRGNVLGIGTRTYQAWYRSSQNFCTPATFNLTNAARATWVP